MASSFCAYCLASIAENDIRKCGNCLKRVYCSRECQKADWKPTFHHNKTVQRGQGHKNWCGLAYGEEGIDWEIVNIPGKGKGVRALRKFEPLSRIMVDACQLTPEAHPATKDLMPENGSLKDKFVLNELGTDDDLSVLCLRLSRVNHDCNQNAMHYYVDGLGVKVLIAEREILAGEEITINYCGLEYDAMQSKTVLSVKWDINCPSTCHCNNLEAQEYLELGKELDRNLIISPNWKSIVKKLLDDRRLQPSLVGRKRTLYDAFQLSLQNGDLVEAKVYLEEAQQFLESATHPKCSEVMKYKRYVLNPKSHVAWLTRLGFY